MYLEYYGLKEAPFSITPDPRFVYLSERHRDALAHLLYGVTQGGGGGFVQLTGEVGTGKTTLCRLLLEQLPEKTRVALVLNPLLSPVELVETICEELRIDLTGRRHRLKSLVDALNEYLLDAYAQGLRVVLIIDEAQELSRESLEQVRLLTNLETPTQKLLQIILLGQPELRDLLARPELRQLAQRITARYHLMPLDADETDAYLRHRLAVAGAQRFPFTKLAVRRLHEFAGGVPRLINVIAERTLLAGYAHEEAQVGERLVERAARETLSGPIGRLKPPRVAWVAAVLLAAVLIGLWALPRIRAERAPSATDTDTAALAATPAAATPTTTPAAARTPPAPPPTPFLDGDAFTLRLLQAEHSDTSAWNQLLALWTLRADQADAATAARCPAQIGPSVYCLHTRGSLTKLAAIGRPVILRLSAEGQQAWVVLLGVDALRARLALAGDTVEVDRTQLERLWGGDYHAIWRAPEFLVLPLRQGDLGPSVDWLHDRLAGRRDAKFATTGPGRFDADTVAAVKRVQTAHGLLPDGVVGLETLFALSADAPGPQLRRDLR